MSGVFVCEQNIVEKCSFPVYLITNILIQLTKQIISMSLSNDVNWDKVYPRGTLTHS